MYLVRLVWIFTATIILLAASRSSGQAVQDDMETYLASLQEAGVYADDVALIAANFNQFSAEQRRAIADFMTDSEVIADTRWFDVSAYTDWNDYNFYRPVGDNVLGILARRDLFLDAARQLNNRAITNMSSAALAALSFSQVYVEEKWDHETPWDGDPNPYFNWVQSEILQTPDLQQFLKDDFLYRQRTEYWWATYWSLLLGLFDTGTDARIALRQMQPPNANVPRLAGYSYPLGNQLYLQTAETVYWYADYLRYGEERYGTFEPQILNTRITFPSGAAELFDAPGDAEVVLWADLTTAFAPEFAAYPGLLGLFNAPFGRELRQELTQPEMSAFWNAMRFLHAAARQREGGASPEHPENGQPLIIALRYEERTPYPVGRQPNEVSAFGVLSTVYSDSLLLDFTNWNVGQNTLIHTPTDDERSDGLNRQVSERNKAVQVVEQMGNENVYPNATHISGTRGLGLNLVTQYDAVDGDFLPYTSQEAGALVSALVAEAEEYGIEASLVTLCNSPLLAAGYQLYVDEAVEAGISVSSWTDIAFQLCSG